MTSYTIKNISEVMIMKPEGQIVLILLLCIILNSIQFIDW